MNESFIEENFKVEEVDGMGKVINWEDYCYTNYNAFAGPMFGKVIEDGLENKDTYDQIIKKMITESITKNYGLTEYLIRYTGVSLI